MEGFDFGFKATAEAAATTWCTRKRYIFEALHTPEIEDLILLPVS